MKVELEIEDLTTAIEGINHAYIALYDVRNNHPYRIAGEDLEGVILKLDKKLEAVKSIYDQLIKYE